MALLDDGELAARFAARSRDGLASAYERYGRLLFTVARNALGDAADAEDCVHDALLRVWRTPGAYRPDRGALGPFLVACVRNEAMTMRRGRTRRIAREERVQRLQPVSTDPPEIADHVAAQQLRDAIAALPDEQRVALETAYYGNRTQVETAQTLGVPLGTVKTRIAAAMRKLAAGLAPAEQA
jgi:RNA polymerase sigma-70 factor, ECF subfamily